MRETPSEIEGSKVIHEFPIPRIGWEMDNVGWITEDGRVWTTSHGHRIHELSETEAWGCATEMRDSLDGLRRAFPEIP